MGVLSTVENSEHMTRSFLCTNLGEKGRMIPRLASSACGVGLMMDFGSLGRQDHDTQLCVITYIRPFISAHNRHS